MIVSDWSVRRIHRIREMTYAQQYLEIGVNKGDTFLHVQLPRKDAVDPAFLFATEPVASVDVRFFDITSDDFFTSTAPRSSYDIVFLDGLHTFEQTLRDFIATLPLAHANTVWLIDDTLPCDVYSSLPNLMQSLQQRKQAGLSGDPWHGDIYKVPLFLHDYCPNLDYATITDRGNPQTLVWRGNRRPFESKFTSLEAISRASYVDLENYAECMRYASEDEAFNLLAKAVSPRLESSLDIFSEKT